MAVFGVRGIVESQFYEKFDFEIRYVVDLHNQPRYYLHAVVGESTEENSEGYDEAVIVQEANLTKMNNRRISTKKFTPSLCKSNALEWKQRSDHL